MTNFEMAIALINAKINETTERYQYDPVALRTYAWGWRSVNTVGSNHGSCFYHHDYVIQICEALGVHTYLKVGETVEGTPTPVIAIFE